MNALLFIQRLGELVYRLRMRGTHHIAQEGKVSKPYSYKLWAGRGQCRKDRCCWILSHLCSVHSGFSKAMHSPALPQHSQTPAQNPCTDVGCDVMVDVQPNPAGRRGGKSTKAKRFMQSHTPVGENRSSRPSLCPRSSGSCVG